MVSLPRPLAATYMDDTGFEGDLVIDAMSDAIEALSTPLTINGNMDHFQRLGAGTQTSTTTYSRGTSYAADKMFVLPAGASVTQTRSTTVPDSKSQFSLLVTGAASVTTVDIGQRIKAAIVNTRGKQSQVFSAYVFNGTGASFTPNLRVGTPAGIDDFTTVTNRLDQALAACPNAVWTRVFYVFDPTAYTNIANGMEVVLRVPTGVLVATKTANVAQFDVRPGGSLVPYVPADPSMEELACLEYIYTVTAELFGKATDATFMDKVRTNFPRRMRVAPTTISASCTASAGSNGTFAIDQATRDSARFFNSAGNWTAAADITATFLLSADL